MYEELLRLSRRFLRLKQSDYRRYLIRTVDFHHRLSIIAGQRGVGKTTTLIQWLLDQVNEDYLSEKILYIQADHFQVGTLSLYEIAEEFQKYGGKWIAFDEIHKYPDWSKELKSIYDTFPNLHVLCSRSSALEIYRGSHDLTRRAVSFHMVGMSFREYLELKHSLTLPSYTLDLICKGHIQIVDDLLSALEKVGLSILREFSQYLKTGYYPFFNEVGVDATTSMIIEQNVHTTLESDLVSIYPHISGSTIHKIKHLLSFIAKTVPFTPNWSKMANTLGIGDVRTLKTYFQYLEDANLIRSIFRASSKMSGLESPEKVLLENSNQLFAIAPEGPEKGTIRETFFLSAVSNEYLATIPSDGDFLLNDQFIFEIGGKKKSYKQIRSQKDSFIASDDIERGVGNRIPLWLFGFLY